MHLSAIFDLIEEVAQGVLAGTAGQNVTVGSLDPSHPIVASAVQAADVAGKLASAVGYGAATNTVAKMALMAATLASSEFAATAKSAAPPPPPSAAPAKSAT